MPTDPYPRGLTGAWVSGAIATVAIVATVAGGVRAGAPEPEYRGHAIGTIRSIDRPDNVVTMVDGLRLRAPDAHLLEDLQAGDFVKVDFAHESATGGSSGPSRERSATPSRRTAAVSDRRRRWWATFITTQTIALANEVTAVQVLGRRMTATVLLVQALGGGWNTAELPSAAAVTERTKER